MKSGKCSAFPLPRRKDKEMALPPLTTLKATAAIPLSLSYFISTCKLRTM